MPLLCSSMLFVGPFWLKASDGPHYATEPPVHKELWFPEFFSICVSRVFVSNEAITSSLPLQSSAQDPLYGNESLQGPLSSRSHPQASFRRLILLIHVGALLDWLGVWVVANTDQTEKDNVGVSLLSGGLLVGWKSVDPRACTWVQSKRFVPTWCGKKNARNSPKSQSDQGFTKQLGPSWEQQVNQRPLVPRTLAAKPVTLVTRLQRPTKRWSTKPPLRMLPTSWTRLGSLQCHPLQHRPTKTDQPNRCAKSVCPIK